MSAVRPAARSVVLIHEIYDPRALDAAATAFGGHCRVTVRPAGADLEVTVAPLEGAPLAVVDEFLNYVLGLSAQRAQSW